MLLCDHEIQHFVESGIIGLEPFDARLIQPTSIDVTLDKSIRLPAAGITHLDMADLQPDHTTAAEIPATGWDLPSGGLLLASTQESVRLPGFLAARVEGKSSVGRVGLAIHITAGFIDPGFQGRVTLEMYNFAPWTLRIYPGMPIGQLCFLYCTPPARDYAQTGHYQGQQQATESRYKFKRP